MSPLHRPEDPFAHISRPPMPETVLGRVFMFYDLRLPDQLRESIQNALWNLIDTRHTYLGISGGNDLEKQAHALSTRVELFTSLNPSLEDEEGEFVRNALLKIAPSVLPPEQVSGFLDLSYVSVWVRAAVLNLSIPLSVKLGEPPKDYHDVSALVLIGGNKPTEDQVVMITRIVMPAEPSTALERIRSEATEATYVPSSQRGYQSRPITSPQILFEKLAQTLARTIQTEATAAIRERAMPSPPQP